MYPDFELENNEETWTKTNCNAWDMHSAIREYLWLYYPTVWTTATSPTRLYATQRLYMESTYSACSMPAIRTAH